MTKPVYVVGTAAGESDWVPMNTAIAPFNLAIGCVCSSNINATYSVEYAHDDPFRNLACTITRSTTTATLTLTNHGLTTSDSIIVSGTGDSNLDGNFEVASVSDQNTITYTVSDTGATSAKGKVSPMRVFAHSTIAAQTANADGNIAFPIGAVRLNITSFTAGYVTMILNRGWVC